MKLKPLSFVCIKADTKDRRFIAKSPFGIFIIDNDNYGEYEELAFNCYLEQEVTLCPENSISCEETLKAAKDYCNSYYLNKMRPFIEE